MLRTRFIRAGGRLLGASLSLISLAPAAAGGALELIIALDFENGSFVGWSDKVPAACDDGIMNGDEAAVDCGAPGGACLWCGGANCASDAQCASNDCFGGLCSRHDCIGGGNACSPIFFNEVESFDEMALDWVELINVGPVAADISGFIVTDNDPTNVMLLSAGTILQPGAHHAFDTIFGLGSTDEIHFFSADNATEFDSYSWNTHATSSYGRCPDGSGAYTDTVEPTFGTANSCP